MKKQEVPQDKSPLENFTREVLYARNNEGKYEKALSTGWDVKKDALDNAWQEVNERIEQARQLVLDGKKSPVYYFMEKNLMDVKVLAAYTGFWKFSVKRHMNPVVFGKLKPDKLEVYATVFEITADELKNFKI